MHPPRWRDLVAAFLFGTLPATPAVARLGFQTAAHPQAPDSRERSRRERELHEQMRQRRTDHFTVSFEGPEEDGLAGRALESLERAYWRIGGTLSLLPYTPIGVVLYSSEQFRDITRAPTWAVAAFDGIVRVPMRGALENPSELDRVLAHEYTHALIHLLAPRNVPAWLNEGLATALEADDLNWARERLRHAGRPVSLGTLRASFRRMPDEEATLAYASSALAVQRLLDEAGGVALANLFRDLGAGVDFDKAFAHRIQRSFAMFQAELNDLQ